ncbi:disintegrin and metalloproteinase domain-containing protein 20-like [Acomys russatus]|uniref:disintegrin and metalloproteinase domain-containing protein 20-like n=1 Tax=Acomys russatus TaxID=60746 RepID=UPI0021E33CC8|nr:disintegrin and metalloproteinase domain-containing protein 20-like [Acomys russatus]
MAPFLRSSTWTEALLGGALWLSVLWVLLSPVCCSRGPPKWRFMTSEVVIPRKVPQRMGGNNMPDQVAYSMRFRGQRHVIHMKLKRNMIPENVPIYTTNDQGAEQEDHPFIPRDCYFYSYLEGVPGSLATLDTCKGGLSGMVQVDDSTYEIKPLATSSKFEHVISLIAVDERSRESKKCRNEDVVEVREPPEEMKFAGSPRAAPTYLWRVHTKNLRVHYTVTHSLHQLANNFTYSLELVLIINSISDSIYKLTGLGVYVTAVCIWEHSDSHDLSRWFNDGPGYLQNFGMWKSRFHTEIPSSVSVIFTGNKVANADYLSNQGSLCHSVNSVVYVCLQHRHFFLAASLMSHAIGHSLSITHDTPGCVCFRRSSCVMNEHPSLLDMWSNCSFIEIHTRIHGWDSCLSSIPQPYHNFKYEVSRCGNLVVDSNEECDCGSFKNCTHNMCCTTACTFTQGSTCDVGGCCINCNYAEAGVRCRDKQGICDLPEYCSGTANHCPENSYIMDGTPCSSLAVCMSGNCSDRNLQCQALFGYKVKDASQTCYEVLNRQGDRFGNCGLKILLSGSKPIKCQDDDIFCGLLHCDGVTRIPGGGEHSTFHHIKVRDVKEHQCFGYDVHHGANIPSYGLVVDGATCGPGKYCKAQSCVFHQTLNYACNISKCNFRGVCNNHGNCHCVQGWEPPTCEQTGAGGSVNSGPPPSTEKRFQPEIHVSVNRILLVLFTRMVLILASLLFGGIIRAAIVIETKQVRENPPAN